MSKRIDYNNENKPITANQATIAPNAAPAVVKTSTGMSLTYKIIAIVLIVLAVLAIALLIVNLIVNSYVNKINTPHYEDVEIKLDYGLSGKGVYSDGYKEQADFKDAANSILYNYAEASHAITENENVYNFAIYGINKFAKDDNGTASFIAVASFNKETKKTTYAIFEEDVLVYIPMTKEIGLVRDAYAWGGAPLLTKTLKHNFGIEIDGYIELDMSVAAELFDSKGGIAVQASKTDINNAIKAYNERFDQKVATVSENNATLNGYQAVAYLRAQNDTSAFVTQISKAIFGKGLGGLMKSFKILSSGANLSLQRDDLIDVALMANSVLKRAEPAVQRVGATGKVHIWHDGTGAYAINCEAERIALLNALYGAEK